MNSTTCPDCRQHPALEDRKVHRLVIDFQGVKVEMRHFEFRECPMCDYKWFPAHSVRRMKHEKEKEIDRATNESVFPTLSLSQQRKYNRCRCNNLKLKSSKRCRNCMWDDQIDGCPPPPTFCCECEKRIRTGGKRCGECHRNQAYKTDLYYEICYDRLDGMTLEQLKLKHGRTRERIRQILSKMASKKMVGMDDMLRMDVRAHTTWSKPAW
jgi:hypothetical protein